MTATTKAMIMAAASLTLLVCLALGGVWVIDKISPPKQEVRAELTKEQFAALIEQFQQVCAKAEGQIYFETNSLGVVTVGCLDRAKINGTAM